MKEVVLLGWMSETSFLDSCFCFDGSHIFYPTQYVLALTTSVSCALKV